MATTISMSSEVLTNIAFGILAAVIGIAGIVQAARYAAYRHRSTSTTFSAYSSNIDADMRHSHDDST